MSRSARLPTSVVRPAQYSDARSVRPSAATPWMKVRMRPVPTGRSRARSSRPNPTSGGTGPLGILPDHLAEVRGDERLILVVLHDGAEGVGGKRGVEPQRAEESQRVRPVDRLGHAGDLGQIELSKPLDRLCHVACELLADLRSARTHDRNLA